MGKYLTLSENKFFAGVLIPPYLSANAINDSIIFSWVEKYDFDVYFEIYFLKDDSYVLLCQTPLNVNTITQTFSKGGEYSFIIRAIINDTPSHFSNPITVNLSHFLYLTSKGDGSGVNRLNINVSANVTLKLTGTSKFYTDALGTLGETDTFIATPGADRTIYFKAPSGTSLMIFQDAKFINKIDVPYVLPTNTPLISGDISGFTNVFYFSFGNDVNCAIGGDVTKLKNLTFLLLQGSTNVYGDITDKTSLTFIAASGLNKISGDITKHTALTNINIVGANLVSGDIGKNNVVNGITPTLYLAPCHIKKYTPGAVWSNANITISPFIGYGYTTNEIDNILNDMANSPTLINKTINLLGGNEHRSVVSDPAIAILTGAGRTNTINTNIQKLPFDNGKIVFTFDGGLASCYTKALPLFIKHNISGTFYITINQVGGVGYITWSEIIDMYNKGMDIECHTNTHPNLTALTEAQVLAQYDAVNAAFIAHGIPTPRHTAYPWGANNANVRAWTATRRDSSRGVLYNRLGTNDEKFDLPSIDLTTETQADLVNIVPALEYIKQNKQAIVFLIHSIDIGTDMKLQQLTDIISYARSMNIDILNIVELYNLM